MREGAGYRREAQHSPRRRQHECAVRQRHGAIATEQARVSRSSNAMVGHAARVHASAGPAVRVCPDKTRTRRRSVLQSARVDRRPSEKVSV